MKKVLSLVLAISMFTMVICLSSCGMYLSSYIGVGLVRKNTNELAFMSFHSFKGRQVFNLRFSSDDEGILTWKAELTDGEIVVYYDNGKKTELFTIHSGEYLNSSIELTNKKPLYLIIETNEKCTDGMFEFTVE